MSITHGEWALCWVGFPEARTVAQGAVQSEAQLQPLRKITEFYVRLYL
jgi:hypothetical protein